MRILGLIIILNTAIFAQFTKEKISQLIADKLSTDKIVSLIKKDCVDFEINADTIKELTASNVPAEIIDAVLECSKQKATYSSTTTFIWDDTTPSKTELKMSKLKTRSMIFGFYIEEQSKKRWAAPIYAKFSIKDYDENSDEYTVIFSKQKMKSDDDENSISQVFNSELDRVRAENQEISIEKIKPYVKYKIKKENFVYGPDFDKSTSLIHGTLAVPFKYRGSSEQISSDGTIGYYAGWSKHYLRFSFAPIISGGVSNINVSTDEGENNQFGITASTGLLFTFRDNFQFGLISGTDYVSGSEWEYDGDLWISFMVGYQFGR